MPNVTTEAIWAARLARYDAILLNFETTSTEMIHINLPLRLEELDRHSADKETLRQVELTRQTVRKLMHEDRYSDALERTVESLRQLRGFADLENTEFRAVLMALLFDLTQIRLATNDLKQAERDLDTLFKVLNRLIETDAERFGEFYILAMELSTHILRSRRKTLDMLARQQTVTNQLFSKVNSGVNAATDRLVDSLRKTAQLLAATGDYRGSLKFYAEAIKYSRRRTGKVGRKEVKMSIEMAEIMIRIRAMRPRATRLLNAVLPHAIALETIELEEDILALLEVIELDTRLEPRWKTFLHSLTIKNAKKTVEKVDKNVGRVEGTVNSFHRKAQETAGKLAEKAEKSLRKVEEKVHNVKEKMNREVEAMAADKAEKHLNK